MNISRHQRRATPGLVFGVGIPPCNNEGGNFSLRRHGCKASSPERIRRSGWKDKRCESTEVCYLTRLYPLGVSALSITRRTDRLRTDYSGHNPTDVPGRVVKWKAMEIASFSPSSSESMSATASVSIASFKASFSAPDNKGSGM